MIPPLPSFAQTAPGSTTGLMPEVIETGQAAPEPGAGGARGIDWIKRVAGDQKTIWSSPLRLGRADAVWALPALAAAGTLAASDSWVSRQVPAGEVSRSRTVANGGTLALMGGAGGMFLLGNFGHNDHAAESGLLAAEAAVNAVAVDFTLKSVFQRQRAYDGTGTGRFFAGGGSFPSEHAAVSWAVAGVVANEYPGTLTKMFSYGLATAVSAARVTGKQHFPSDVLAGGALGYFIARQIYQQRRDPEVSSAAWGSFGEIDILDRDKLRSPHNMGSPYVPPDNWVYSRFERLAALGYIPSAYLGIRPWTRMQCARFLDEAADNLRAAAGDAGDDPAARPSASREAAQLWSALSDEFAPETRRLEGSANLGLALDSVYVRTTDIAGPPLTDGYHFAQTLINDYGRPYGRGFNSISGLAGHGEAGPLLFSFQGEYQQARPVPAYAEDVQQAISQADQVPPLPGGSRAIERFTVIGGAAGVTYHDLQISFGKQAEWLGVGDSGPLLASTNAPSILMVQVQNVVPYRLPLLSKLLGPVESVFFVGQLSGQNFVYNPPNVIGPGFHPQPFVHGNKASFKPTPNLEFGMGVTAIFGGPGLPFTWSEFVRSYYSHKVSISENPAKRFSGFDISYRVPGIRKWLTVYNDSLVGDEISPIGSSRPLLSPGLYLPQLPKIAKLELRFEGVTDPFTREFLPGFVYYDRRYRSGYTNGGNLISSWVGRDGFGGQGQVTYWFSVQTKLKLGYRYQEADCRFLAGGRLADYWLRAETRRKSGAAIAGSVQYEQWMFPLLAASRQANVSASLELSYRPQAWRRH